MDIRVRFAPSPTGVLHIGGVRTALYNYLFAKKHNGKFIIRIEDTDTERFTEGAEEYINKSLEWLGIVPDEGVLQGGDFGPYKQSERKHIYAKYAHQMVLDGKAYYAFDTQEDLNNVRTEFDSKSRVFKYDCITRQMLNNSLTQPESVVKEYLDKGDYTIRVKLEPDQTIEFVDEIRGHVSFNTNDLDDKVLFKGSTQMPTYHLANVVDDYLMKISHVIRGEEWLPSAPLHILLYQYLGFGDVIPTFVHLPLILRPDGRGKLKKRDGAEFNIPVYPIKFDNGEISYNGFSDFGFLPDAVLNFLLLLGWHPSDEKEIFTIDEMIKIFDFSGVSKGGARFDFDKAKWFNNQYISNINSVDLLPIIKSELNDQDKTDSYLLKAIDLVKSRVHLIPEIVSEYRYLYKRPDYNTVNPNDLKVLNKKVLPKLDDLRQPIVMLLNLIFKIDFKSSNIKETLESVMNDNGIKFGDVMPTLRYAITGTFKGPDLFEMIELLGQYEFSKRINNFLDNVNEK